MKTLIHERHAFYFIRLALPAMIWCSTAFAGNLSWYTGDPDTTVAGTIGLTNMVYSGGQANVYDAFVVPTGGWIVNAVFSNDSVNPIETITQANWQIRSGMSSGNGGTLIAGGTSTATQTQIFAGSGFVIDTVQVSGLSVSLSPGEYWLSVAPVDAHGSEIATVPTLDTNAIGLPVENGRGQLTFDNFPVIGENYVAQPSSGGSPRDWSMGLYSTSTSATPEPSTLVLVAVAVLPLVQRLRRRPGVNDVKTVSEQTTGES